MDVERFAIENRGDAGGAWWRRDALASVVVFLVALPLCMGIAIASGMPVSAGLITGIVGGLVVGVLAGSPLQVSGPAAGLTVIVLAIVQQHGPEMLGPVVLIAGGFQILAGALSLGPWFRAVSPAVIKGMLSGIGVLIFVSQIHVMVDDAPRKNGVQNLITIPEALAKGLPLPEWQPAEERQFRSDLLKQLAKLHEAQREITDEVHTRVSDHSTPGEATAQAVTLEPLRARQAEVAQQVERVSQTLTERSNGNVGNSLASRRDSAVEANRAVAAALQDLEAAVRDKTIPKTQDEAGRVFADVRLSQNVASESLENLSRGLRSHDWAAKIGLATIALIILWQTFTPKALRLIPAPLIAVVAVTAASMMLVLPIKTVELPERLADGIRLLSFSVFKDVSFMAILQGALLIAVVASAETLLCATAVDQLHQGARTNYDRELAAQGVGNMLCGLLGGLPMTGVIVRSAANVQAGATTRLSAVLHGAWLLAAVALFGAVLQSIPTACLAGLLVYTGFKLMDIKGLKELSKYGWGEVVIFLTTVTMIVVTDLLTGVVAGIVLSGVKLLYTFSHLHAQLDIAEDRQSAKLSLEGSATFIRLPRLAAVLESVPRGAELHVDLEHLTYIDHACLDLLMSWARQHEAADGRLIVDWDSLHATFREGTQPPSLRNGANGANGNGRRGAGSNGHAHEPHLEAQSREAQRR